jgi:hypothetical protein
VGGCGKEWEENLGKHNRRSGIRPKKKRVSPVCRSFNYIFMQQPQKNPYDIHFNLLTYRNFFSKLGCTRVKPNKEISEMKTEQIFTFVVRIAFNNFKQGDTFRAAVRTFVENLVEKQNFVMEDGSQITGVPCKCTQFCEKRTKIS